MTSNDAGYQDHDTVTEHPDPDHADRDHDHADHDHDAVVDSDPAFSTADDVPAGDDSTKSLTDDTADDNTPTDDEAPTFDGEPVLIVVDSDDSLQSGADPALADDAVDSPPAAADSFGATDLTATDDGTDSAATPDAVLAPVPAVGAPAESSAGLDPVSAATPSAVSPTTADTDSDWHDLQGQFVDDPAAAVREAGSRVERALAELRTRVETGSTEDLRTAFRRYRDLHASLH